MAPNGQLDPNALLDVEQEGAQAVQAGEDFAAKPTLASGQAALAHGVLLEKAILPVVQETKAGYKTTEFWASLGTALTVLLTNIPVHDKLYVSIVAGVYALARGLAKNGVGNTPPT